MPNYYDQKERYGGILAVQGIHMNNAVHHKKSAQRGQSFIEVLIALAVAAILLGGAVTLIQLSLRIGHDNVFLQTAWFVNQGSMDTVTAVAGAGWGLLRDHTGSDPNYFFSVNAPPACLLNPTGPGCGGLTFIPCLPTGDLYPNPLAGTNYYLCFSLQTVERTNVPGASVFGTGDIFPPCLLVPHSLCPGTTDPSTIRLAVKTLWGANKEFETPPLVKYLTRHINAAFDQTDWSGGEGQAGLWNIKNQFDTENNVITTTNGKICPSSSSQCP